MQNFSDERDAETARGPCPHVSFAQIRTPRKYQVKYRSQNRHNVDLQGYSKITMPSHMVCSQIHYN